MTRSVLLRPGLYGMMLCAGLAAFACSDEDGDSNNNISNNNNDNANNNSNNQPTQNIVEVATANGSFTTLLGAATAAGLDTVLSDPTATLTVFAPTDEAFATLDARPDVDLSLISNDVLGNILLQHVIGRDVPGTEVLTSPTLTTEAKLPLVVDATGSPITVGDADLSSLIDVPATNGRIHVMDEVIVPPTTLEVAAAIPDSFSSLVAAVNQSAAASPTVRDALDPATLTGADPITVFAPNNDAFTASGIDLTTISDNELDRILSHHAAVGQVLSTDLQNGQVITTLNGSITVNVTGGSVSLTDESGNTVNVIDTDIRTRSGVIHVIDGVLIPKPTVVDIAIEADFNALVGAVVATDLVGTLTGPGPFTVFAPTDTAFETLETAVQTDLTLVSGDVVANILLHHVVAGDFDSSVVTATTGFTSQAKLPLAVDTSGLPSGPITIGGANLTTNAALLDLDARNGVVHVMDQVIVPPTIIDVATELDAFSLLEIAVGRASADVQSALEPDTLDVPNPASPITVFAPTDDAFIAAGIDPATISENLLNRVLQHHAVVGQNLSTDLSDGQVIPTLNGNITVNVANDQSVSLTDESGNTVNVIDTDIRTLTGVIHVIDGVLIPKPTVVDIAIEADFTSLVDAVVAADLVGTLTSTGPFTVFAPTNQAFIDLGVDLSVVSTDVVANILLHHTATGDFDSTAVLGATSLPTEAKTSLAIDTSGLPANPVTIGGANLTTDPNFLDLDARNGIVHVMDGVIVPPSIVQVADDTESLSILFDALGAASLVGAVSPDVLSGDQPLTVFAPTNEAFTAAGITDPVNNPPANLASVLTYHVVQGQFLSTDLSDGQIIPTVNGANLTVDIVGSDVFLIDEQSNSIQILDTDIRTLTGVVHVIGGVLLPPAIQ